MAFVDEVTVRVQSGAGGNGCVSFRREKFIPFGGPNGGNGGKGGDVYFVPSRNKQSLLDFKFQPFFRAERGQHGMGKDMDGRSGEDLLIEVPPGTQVYDLDTNTLLADLTEETSKFLVAKGGSGGRGNKSFTTSVQRAPRIATPGTTGESKELRLELRLMADIGLVGLPNAGKSSFLKYVSRAKPKVADYPFTTLDPNLGVATFKGQQRVIADLPGLIEGASEGAGLGHKFLRHTTRNRLLVHVVDASGSVDSTLKNIEIVEKELASHGEENTKPRAYLFTKADLTPVDWLKEKAEKLAEKGFEGHFVSNHTGYGMEDALQTLFAIEPVPLEEEPSPEDTIH